MTRPAPEKDIAEALAGEVEQAFRDRAALCIRGSGSKDFLGREPAGRKLDVSRHRGVISYEPTELVLTARSGTRLSEIRDVLADQGQMLAFEPPAFGDEATLGGTIAAGLSGPRRPYAGSARDFVLGVTMLNGQGESGRFGGEVIKNVAGYDVSRLMAGAMGTLGVLLDVSLKVLPRPEAERTRVFKLSAAAALEKLTTLGRLPIPLSGAAWMEGRLYVRLSGSASGVSAAERELIGEPLAEKEAAGFWTGLREHRLDFFADDRPLWRLGLPPAAPELGLDGKGLIDWGGGQRWLFSALPAETIRDRAAAAGGHATLFRGGDRREAIFHPLSQAMLALHQRVKAALDPAGIFNPGRLYEGL